MRIRGGDRELLTAQTPGRVQLVGGCNATATLRAQDCFHLVALDFVDQRRDAVLRDRALAADRLAAVLARPREEMRRLLASDRVWQEWPGPFQWTQVASLTGLRGVYLSRRLERYYPKLDFGAQNANTKSVYVTACDIRATPGISTGLNSSPPWPWS